MARRQGAEVRISELVSQPNAQRRPFGGWDGVGGGDGGWGGEDNLTSETSDCGVCTLLHDHSEFLSFVLGGSVGVVVRVEGNVLRNRSLRHLYLPYLHDIEPGICSAARLRRRSKICLKKW